jgi:hypothetical protein
VRAVSAETVQPSIWPERSAATRPASSGIPILRNHFRGGV